VSEQLRLFVAGAVATEALCFAQAASWQGMVHHNTADSMDGDMPPEPEGLSPTAPPRSPVSYAPGCYKKPIDAVLAQTKRHLHDVVNDFERKRTAYFVEAFHSHRVYWQVRFALYLNKQQRWLRRMLLLHLCSSAF
jgi:hypothetical protein